MLNSAPASVLAPVDVHIAGDGRPYVALAGHEDHDVDDLWFQGAGGEARGLVTCACREVFPIRSIRPEPLIYSAEPDWFDEYEEAETRRLSRTVKAC